MSQPILGTNMINLIGWSLLSIDSEVMGLHMSLLLFMDLIYWVFFIRLWKMDMSFSERGSW